MGLLITSSTLIVACLFIRHVVADEPATFQPPANFGKPLPTLHTASQSTDSVTNDASVNMEESKQWRGGFQKLRDARSNSSTKQTTTNHSRSSETATPDSNDRQPIVERSSAPESAERQEVAAHQVRPVSAVDDPSDRRVQRVLRAFGITEVTASNSGTAPNAAIAETPAGRDTGDDSVGTTAAQQPTLRQPPSIVSQFANAAEFVVSVKKPEPPPSTMNEPAEPHDTDSAIVMSLSDNLKPEQSPPIATSIPLGPPQKVSVFAQDVTQTPGIEQLNPQQVALPNDPAPQADIVVESKPQEGIIKKPEESSIALSPSAARPEVLSVKPRGQRRSLSTDMEEITTIESGSSMAIVSDEPPATNSDADSIAPSEPPPDEADLQFVVGEPSASQNAADLNFRVDWEGTGFDAESELSSKQMPNALADVRGADDGLPDQPLLLAQNRPRPQIFSVNGPLSPLESAPDELDIALDEDSIPPRQLPPKRSRYVVTDLDDEPPDIVADEEPVEEAVEEQIASPSEIPSTLPSTQIVESIEIPRVKIHADPEPDESIDEPIASSQSSQSHGEPARINPELVASSAPDASDLVEANDDKIANTPSAAPDIVLEVGSETLTVDPIIRDDERRSPVITDLEPADNGESLASPNTTEITPSPVERHSVATRPQKHSVFENRAILQPPKFDSERNDGSVESGAIPLVEKVPATEIESSEPEEGMATSESKIEKAAIAKLPAFMPVRRPLAWVPPAGMAMSPSPNKQLPLPRSTMSSTTMEAPEPRAAVEPEAEQSSQDSMASLPPEPKSGSAPSIELTEIDNSEPQPDHEEFEQHLPSGDPLASLPLTTDVESLPSSSNAEVKAPEEPRALVANSQSPPDNQLAASPSEPPTDARSSTSNPEIESPIPDPSAVTQRPLPPEEQISTEQVAAAPPKTKTDSPSSTSIRRNENSEPRNMPAMQERRSDERIAAVPEKRITRPRPAPTITRTETAEPRKAAERERQPSNSDVAKVNERRPHSQADQNREPAEDYSPKTPVITHGKVNLLTRQTSPLRMDGTIERATVADTDICDVIQFSADQVVVIAKGQGTTNVRLWLRDRAEPMNYEITVNSSEHVEASSDQEYRKLAKTIRDLYPSARVELIPAGERLVAKGTVTSREEAIQILSLVRRVRLTPVVDELVIERTATRGSRTMRR